MTKTGHLEEFEYGSDKVYENKEGYAYYEGKPTKMGKRVKLEVTVMLDPVPGAYHQIEDHVRLLMFTNPYIQQIEVKDD